MSEIRSEPERSSGRGASLVSWAAQLVAAGILAQTLYFKFSGAPESKYIFSTLGLEPWGRIGSGVAELVAVVLLCTPGLAVYGALLTLGVLSGAIASHLLILGIEVQGDGGLLFGLALVASACAALVLVLRRRRIPVIGARFA